MNYFKIASRQLNRKGARTFAKIVTLATGLAFSIILLSEVFYYFSFDSIYPDSDRIYSVVSNFKRENDKGAKPEDYNFTSGAIANGIREESSGVEVATRGTHIGTHIFYTDDYKRYEAKFFMADEKFYDVLSRPMCVGIASDILSKPMYCMISDKIADIMGGKEIVMGKSIELKSFRGKKLTIGGVFKALPENTNIKYDILVSLSSIGNFSFDGSENWIGNDRYASYLKLQKGVDPESLSPGIRRMQEKYQDIVNLEKKGLYLKYSLVNIRDIYTRYKDVSNMIMILLIIAFAVLFTSLMNYILLSISSIVDRAKTSAVHKCYGAKEHNLQKIIFSETVITFMISLIAALFIIVALKDTIEAQVAHKLISTLNIYVVIPIMLLMVVIVCVISFIPGRLFSNIPVAIAFRNYRQGGNRWKLGLLFIQFVGASFLITTLYIVSLQYNRLMSADHGYSTDKVYWVSTSWMDANKVNTVLSELKSLPEVSMTALGSELPIDRASGNNVLSQDRSRDLFNIADMYFIDDNFMKLMDIPIIDGENFSPESAKFNDVLVSKYCADLLVKHNNWKDGVVGKEIAVSEHSQGSHVTSRIIGVYPDIVIGSLANRDDRPSVFFYSPDMISGRSSTRLILVKTLEKESPGLMSKIKSIFDSVSQEKDTEVYSLRQDFDHIYDAQKGFRNAIIIGGVVVLIITVIGLLGYTSSEVARRSKELAIRKINGAEMRDVMRIFAIDIEKVAIPAVFVGLIGAYYLMEKWMRNFSEKTPLDWWIFVALGVVILLFIGVIAIFNCMRIANQNPVDIIKES